jgi:hypothetical protein
MQGDVARQTGIAHIHKLLVLAEIGVDTVPDSEFVEMICIPIKNLEDYKAELFEGHLVRDFEVATPARQHVARLWWEDTSRAPSILNA